MKLASEFDASLVFFNQAQKDLRAINSDCDFDRDCFETEALYHIIDKLCPSYQDYNFISEKECNRAGDKVMDLVLGKIEPSIPIRNTNQDWHNDRMYELEKEKLCVQKGDRWVKNSYAPIAAYCEKDDYKRILERESEKEYRAALRRQAEWEAEQWRREDSLRLKRVNSLIAACEIEFSDCYNKCYKHYILHNRCLGGSWTYPEKCKDATHKRCATDEIILRNSETDFSCKKDKDICVAKARATP